MRWPLVLVLLAGCDKLFDLSHIDGHPPGDGPIDTRTWGTGEPSTGAGDDCVRANYSTTGLDSMACATMNAFVCECDDYKLDPTHYTLPLL